MADKKEIENCLDVKFSDLEVLHTLADTHPLKQPNYDCRPIYHRWYFFCKHKDTGDYYCWIHCDHYERGEYVEPVPDFEVCFRVPEELAQFIDAFRNGHAPIEQKPVPTLMETAVKQIAEYGGMVYQLDLLNDVKELAACLEVGAHRAVLAMAGRILETCLKAHLLMSGIDVSQDLMVGALLKRIEDDTSVYVDPGAKNTWNIINKQRIVGVHAKELVPIPSAHQTLMVCHAILDTLERLHARLQEATNEEKRRISL